MDGQDEQDKEETMNAATMNDELKKAVNS